MSNQNSEIKPGDFVGKKNGSIKDYYEIHEKIGNGGFSKVYLAKQKATGMQRIIKVVKKEMPGVFSKEEILNEINLLKELDHPNIMKVIEYFSSKSHLYIVAEYLKGGELFDKIIQEGFFSEAKAINIITQVLSAVSYLHKHNITHRDLKPENIVFEDHSPNSPIKIIDFGTCHHFVKNEKLKSTIGTPYYIAPEVLTGNYNQLCDIWSCGVILYILMCGCPPFNGKNENEIFSKIKEGKYIFKEQNGAIISKEAKKFIGRMLTLDYKNRPTAEQLLLDPWLKSDMSNNQVALPIIDNLRSFKIDYTLQKAILIYFVNFFDLNEEKKKLMETFKMIDKNHDGQISKFELKEVLEQSLPATEANLEVDRIFKQIDVNNTGEIDFSEYLMANVDYKKHLNEQNLKKIFDLIDSNHSKSIDVSELKEFFHIHDANGLSAITTMIKEVDTDKDGSISFPEFLELMQKYSEKLM